ncbi:glucosidase II beta subunit-like protein-domain-containing protein [Lenzites betulinus]|nr:glucosidase II beta subunit-like protein-domain-containing protein [Lenzites betulinus]
MRTHTPALATLAALALAVDARIHHSRVPEDPYAFPKYRVSFLHGLPVLNDTAERWLREGLRGGELEFLDQPWEESHSLASPLKSIEASDDLAPPDAQEANYTLQRMKFGPKSSFVCLIPPPPTEPPAVVDDAPTDVATPVHSWSLLQPLSGKCLYHRQGWFTYSYCHNSHVRQFHELHHQHIPSTGEYKPEEDPEWEAYTLGRAPPTLEAGAELTTAEAAAAANLELARGAGSRYLVQRWGEGTYCDKMNRKRDVEVQFHCSMTMTDTILFVKETQTCHYVVHIATPRLCGEPGFRSRVDAAEEHYIRCREVLDGPAHAAADRDVRPAPHPFRRPPPPKKVLAPPAAPGTESAKGEGPGAQKDAHAELLRRAIEQLLAHQGIAPGDVRGVGADGEVVFGFVDIDVGEDGEGQYADIVLGEEEGDLGARLHEILRMAGYDVADIMEAAADGEKEKEKEGVQGDADGRARGEEEEGSAAKKQRDEL